MAQRDRSQGFGFVYVDIAALLAQRDQLKKEFSQPVDTGTSQAVRFAQPVASPTKSMPAAPSESVADETRDHKNAVAQIRDNLDRLQSLHHKLHAMLEEINLLSGRNKK